MIDSQKDDQPQYNHFDGTNHTKYLDCLSVHAYQSLPPTPSSSARSFITSVHQGSVGDNDGNNSTSLRLSIPKPYYGSFLSPSYPSSPTADSSKSLMMPSDHSVPSTPPHTTICPDDDEEGLYLAWTHQLLREQGLRPQSCHGGLDNEDDDDSSLSDGDSLNYNDNNYRNKNSNKSFLSSLLVCLPTSCFQK